MTEAAPGNPVPPAVPIPPEAPLAPVAPVAGGAPVITAPLFPGEAAKKTWSVGTITYTTTAALMTVVFWLLLGDAGSSLRDRAFPDTMNLLLKKLGASNTALVILTVVLSNALIMLFGPTISYKSDRYRSRLGRRIPFLLISTPIAAVAMIGIAFTPELGRSLASLSPAYGALIVFGLCSAMYQMASIVTGAAFTGLINDVVPRPVLGRFYGAFRIVSLIAGVIINYLILRHVESHFRLIVLSLAGIFFITFMMMSLAVKEGGYPPPDTLAQDDIRAGGFFAAVRTYIRECFKNPYYRWVFAMLALAGLAGVPVNSFSIFYMKSLKMDTGTYGEIKAVNHACGILFAFPIGMLVDRFHPLRVSMVTMAMYAMTLMMGAIFIRTPSSFGWAVFGHMVVSGFFLSSSGALAQMLLPRIKFATFASASGVITAVATILLSMGMGFLLDKTHSNYRLTYVASSILAFAALAVMIVVYRKFMELGGPKGYVPPDPSPAPRGFAVVQPVQT